MLTVHSPMLSVTVPSSKNEIENVAHPISINAPRPQLSANCPPQVEVAALARFKADHSNNNSTTPTPNWCPSNRIKVSEARANVNSINTSRYRRIGRDKTDQRKGGSTTGA